MSFDEEVSVTDNNNGPNQEFGTLTLCSVPCMCIYLI
jgi:hypothetical protein